MMDSSAALLCDEFFHCCRSTHMTHKQDHTVKSPPVSSYDRALARAVEWLGDRYLLAKPINAHTLPRRENIGVSSTA
jgi:hypothetical protein